MMETIYLPLKFLNVDYFAEIDFSEDYTYTFASNQNVNLKASIIDILNHIYKYSNANPFAKDLIGSFKEVFNFIDNLNLSYFAFVEFKLSKVIIYAFFSTKMSKEDFYNQVSFFKKQFMHYISFYKASVNNSKLKNKATYKYEIPSCNENLFSHYIDLKSFDESVSIQKYPITTKFGKSAYLTQKQAYIIIGFIKGYSYKEIEMRFGIKIKAIETYLRNIRARTCRHEFLLP